MMVLLEVTIGGAESLQRPQQDPSVDRLGAEVQGKGVEDVVLHHHFNGS